MRKYIVTFIDSFFISTLFLLLNVSTAAAQQLSEIAPHAERSLLLDSAVAGNGIIVVGERGHVLKSSDQGRTWRQIVVPTRVMLTAVDFFDAMHGFVVGHDAVILRTQDGGNSWQIVHQAAEEDRPLFDVIVHHRQKITAVGAYGLYLQSEDAGSTWVARPLMATDRNQVANDEQAGEGVADDFHLNQIAVADSGRWFIAAEAGNIYRSDDEGGEWVRLPSPYDGSFFGVLPLAADQLLIVGMQGRMFYSANAGERWQPITTGTAATLTHALRLRTGGVVVTGHSGSVLMADRNQDRFELIQLPQRMAISSVIELVDGNLLLVGAGGALRWSPHASQ